MMKLSGTLIGKQVSCKDSMYMSFADSDQSLTAVLHGQKAGVSVYMKRKNGREIVEVYRENRGKIPELLAHWEL